MHARRIVGVSTLLMAGALALVRPALAVREAKELRGEPGASRGATALALFVRFDPRAWLDELLELASVGRAEARLVASAQKGPKDDGERRGKPNKPR